MICKIPYSIFQIAKVVYILLNVAYMFGDLIITRIEKMTEMDIERFAEAQERAHSGYEQALQEMQQGEKYGHWIWYIFPQVRGLGHSSMSEFFGIADLAEAREYLSHPVLGQRLREITEVVLSHADDRLAIELMGSEVDVLKLKSSMTLFDRVSPNDIFADVLDAYYDGERCRRTLMMLR